MNRRLISYVGDTDPIRNDREAGVLRMMRHLKPTYVYLIVTSRINESWETKYKPAFDFYSKKCNITLNVIKYEGDVHKYDDVFKKTQEILMDIKNEISDGSEFLFNLTSGTPQLVNALSVLGQELYGVTAKYYQCHNPEPCVITKGSQTNKVYTKDEIEMIYELEEETNADQHLVNLVEFYYQKELKSKHQIVYLIKKYEYLDALRYAKEIFKNEMLAEEISAVFKRTQLKFDKKESSQIDYLLENLYILELSIENSLLFYRQFGVVYEHLLERFVKKELEKEYGIQSIGVLFRENDIRGFKFKNEYNRFNVPTSLLSKEYNPNKLPFNVYKLLAAELSNDNNLIDSLNKIQEYRNDFIHKLNPYADKDVTRPKRIRDTFESLKKFCEVIYDEEFVYKNIYDNLNDKIIRDFKLEWYLT